MSCDDDRYRQWLTGTTVLLVVWTALPLAVAAWVWMMRRRGGLEGSYCVHFAVFFDTYQEKMWYHLPSSSPFLLNPLYHIVNRHAWKCDGINDDFQVVGAGSSVPPFPHEGLVSVFITVG